MLVHVLTISSAVALASGLTVAHKKAGLREKLCSQTRLARTVARKPRSSTSGLGARAGTTRIASQGVQACRFVESGSREALQGAKQGLLAIGKVFVISMGGRQGRDEQLGLLAAGEGNKAADAADRQLNRRIKASIGVMGLAAVGCWFYAPLLRLAGAGSLYVFIPVFGELSRNLKKGKITTELLEIVSLISFLVTGYFFLAAFVSFLALLNFKLVNRTEEHSHDQLIHSFSQKPHAILVVKDGIEIEMPLAAVRKRDIVVVGAGETIPVDGQVIAGMASVDQHSLTGEFQPAEVELGSKVFATTLVLSGRLHVQAEATGSDTNAASIGHILEHTQLYKERVRLRGKKIADAFIAPTLFVSTLSLPLLGSSAAMGILWSGFGYNMKVYGPITVLNYLHIMAKNGVLIKDGRSLEMLQQIDTVVFDKTGTLTADEPRLGRIHPVASFDETTILAYAAAAERRQSHPIARAIRAAAQSQGLDIPYIDDASYRIGYGIEVKFGQTTIKVGSARFMQQQAIRLEEGILGLQQAADANGSSLVYVAVDNTLAGVMELEPCVRSEAERVVDYLKEQGIEPYIISGDHEESTRRLATQLGIKHYFSETLPAEKAAVISQLRDRGRFVAYIGDGINDAIALKQANVSISLKGASTAATDTAQVILMDGDLEKLETLFEISKDFENDMRGNYLNSVIPGVITLGGVFLFNFGLAGSMAVYFSSKLYGLMHCMLPLVQEEMKGGELGQERAHGTSDHRQGSGEVPLGGATT